MFDDLDLKNNKNENGVAFDDVKPSNAVNNNFSEKEKKNNFEASVVSSGAEDMFADVDKAKPKVFQPKQEEAPTKTSRLEENIVEKNPQKIFIFLIFILGFILIVAGGFWGYQKFFKSSSKVNNAGLNNQKNNTVNTPAPTVNNKTKNINTTNKGLKTKKTVENQAIIDSDQDGLSDIEEKALGTDPHNSDTDGDGLFDREEVKVYHTDPLNYDTDGDGYSDGQEVKGGYNPKGTGRLYKIKK